VKECSEMKINLKILLGCITPHWGKKYIMYYMMVHNENKLRWFNCNVYIVFYYSFSFFYVHKKL